MTQRLTRESIVTASKGQVSCDMGGEAAILNMQNGFYYGLDPVGARIWNLIQQPRLVADLQETLLREFDVEPTRCESDLLALLTNLHGEGLIEIHGA